MTPNNMIAIAEAISEEIKNVPIELLDKFMKKCPMELKSMSNNGSTSGPAIRTSLIAAIENWMK